MTEIDRHDKGECKNTKTEQRETLENKTKRTADKIETLLNRSQRQYESFQETAVNAVITNRTLKFRLTLLETTIIFRKTRLEDPDNARAADNV